MKTKMVISVLLCCMLSVNGVYAEEEPLIYSTSPTAVAQGDPNFQPAAVDDPKITFSEYSVGTFITNQYANLGIVFSGDSPFITTDDANPTSPVLSGTPKFQGSIEGTFVNPSNVNSPAYVSWFSLDAGYFDETGTTRLEWFGPSGAKLGEVYNDLTGIQTFYIVGTSIASWRISMPEDSDSAGFALDNIDFGEPYAVRLTKTDDVEDCTSPQENIEYTICFENAYGQVVQDPFIIDWLP